MAKGSRARGIGPALAAVLPQDGVRWWRRPHLVKLNICLGFLFLFSSANGYDGSMMNGLQALPQWQEYFDAPYRLRSGAWLGFLNAVQSLGAITCLPAVAWACNRFGRKKVIWSGYFWLALGVAVQTSAQNAAGFAIGRFFVGFVSGTWGGSAPLLMAETAFPTHRGVITACFQCGWYVGSLVAAWTTYGTRLYTTSWAWRIPSLVQIAIPLLALPGFAMAPESPRWLLSKKREEEARKVLVDHHGGGDADSALVAFELHEIKSTLELEERINAETGWTEMFKGKGNRHRTFITITLGIFGQWNGVGIAGYYLAPVLATVGVTSVTDQTLISGFLQVWNLFLALAGAFGVDRLGRRPLFLASCIGMLLSYIFITAFAGSFANTGKASLGIAVIPFLFLFYGSYDIAFTPLLPAYPCEIWNFTYRARGLALMSWTTQLAVFFNIFVNPIALESIQWRYYAVYVALLCFITLTVYLTYPETRGASLEEVARVFDGDAAAVPDEYKIKEDIALDRRGSVSSKTKAVVTDHVEETA